MSKQLARPHNMRTERGYVLTEMLIVVAIIAAILGAVASIASAESASQTAKAEGRMLENVADEIRLIFTRQQSLNGLDLGTTIDLDLWPDSRIVAGNSVVSTWGSDITLSVAAGLDSSLKTIRINVADVPQNACATLASYPFTYERMTVDGQIVFNAGQFGAVVSPLDVSLIASQCGDAASEVSIWFSKDIF